MPRSPHVWDVAAFGRRLKARLSQEGDQKRLADHLGVTQAAVSKWVKGASTPTVENFVRICRLLRCTPASLLGINVDEPVPPDAPLDAQHELELIDQLQEAERKSRAEIDAQFARVRERALRRKG